MRKLHFVLLLSLAVSGCFDGEGVIPDPRPGPDPVQVEPDAGLQKMVEISLQAEGYDEIAARIEANEYETQRDVGEALHKMKTDANARAAAKINAEFEAKAEDFRKEYPPMLRRWAEDMRRRIRE